MSENQNKNIDERISKINNIFKNISNTERIYQKRFQIFSEPVAKVENQIPQFITKLYCAQ